MGLRNTVVVQASISLLLEKDLTYVTVIDTETTGDGDADQVIELAAVLLDVQRRIVVSTYSTLLKPSVPIMLEARAVHHISDAELANAQAGDTFKSLPPLWHQNYAFHNADFDQRLLRQTFKDWPEKPTICTWRCSLHLYPEAPRHSNQVLRYWLNLNVPSTGHPPHRALPDALTTSCILLKMLETHSLDELIRLTSAPALLTKFRFGKHRGEPLENVPKDYLRWMKRTRGVNPDAFTKDDIFTADHYLGNGK